ncbi:MAG TPA: hypothetical protein VGD38_08945, partial [Pyrinomonadaceae bacterium]
MKAKLSLTILFLLSGTATAFGQTVSAIEMSTDYTSDGQVCQMKLFPKRVGPNTDYLSHQLPFQEVKLILNRLIPPMARGNKGELFGYTDTGGGMAWTTYP